VEEEGSDDPDLNVTVVVRRKAAKRTSPWDLASGELTLVSSSPPQAEDFPVAKKPRLEEPLSRLEEPRLEKPFSVSTDEAGKKTSSHDTTAGRAPTAADEDIDDDNHVDDDDDPVKGTRVTGYWTAEEDAKLNSAVTNTCQKKWGKEYKTDWAAVAALVPGRAKLQCKNRWRSALHPSIDRENGHKGRWTANEDSKLKDAVQTHGDMNCGAISALVPGRTNTQCSTRWTDVLDPINGRASGRKGRWEEDEDIKLKDGVQTHGSKNWGVIAALVPGRTNTQCYNRWHYALYPSIDGATDRRTGTWTEDEDIKLKDAVHTHGGKNWAAIATLVSGRTKTQCLTRWHHALDPSIHQANERKGKWVEDEDSKLMDGVQTHGSKNWGVIAALVPGRTKIQCKSRWYAALDPSMNRENGHKGKWTADEDIKLKDALQTHGKNWAAIASLVPGRTKKQCYDRWNNQA
jgi:hypothetical protein